ncbi:MAG: hypothetical protein E7266_09020 [Lachnospiraceae bacterium]|nr:hypothetical protein [Lachnospiraceae bacterium]
MQGYKDINIERTDGWNSIMIGVEIVLLIVGIVVVGISFIFGELLTSDDNKAGIDKETINKATKEIVEKEVEYELANVIDDKVEKTEAELDKMTNEKIMALGSYSDNVMEEINKNHMEVMFLYNMLSEKEDAIKDTIRDIEALKTSVKQMAVANDFAKQAAAKKTVVQRSVPEETEVIDKQPVFNDVSFDEQPQDIDDMIADISGDSADEPIMKNDSVNNNQRILELYNKGLSNIEIAKELGLGIGEVKLVISLFNSTKK